MKIKEILNLTNEEFLENGIENYFYEARELIAFVLDQTKEWVAANLESEVDENNYKKFVELKNKRIQGTPLQYILGEQYFMGLKFLVNKDVLIPRPDTEVLVYEVLELVKKYPKNLKILDLCTGSGCIAISLVKNVYTAEIFASDISEKALAVAEKNSELNGTDVKFMKSDMFGNIVEKDFDIIVSNPPYIVSGDMASLSKEVLEEPHGALDGGADGLDFYRNISENALNYLGKNGALALEIGYNQAEGIFDILRKFKYNNIRLVKDYSGNDRVIIAQNTF
jgi:release factor glutamine methyltransferase